MLETLPRPGDSMAPGKLPRAVAMAKKPETAAEVLRLAQKRVTAPAPQPSHLAGRIHGPVRARPGRRKIG